MAELHMYIVLLHCALYMCLFHTVDDTNNLQVNLVASSVQYCH